MMGPQMLRGSMQVVATSVSLGAAGLDLEGTVQARDLEGDLEVGLEDRAWDWDSMVGCFLQGDRVVQEDLDPHLFHLSSQ